MRNVTSMLMLALLSAWFALPSAAQIFGGGTGGGPPFEDGSQVTCTLSQLASPSTCSAEDEGTLVLLTDGLADDRPNRCDPGGAGGGGEQVWCAYVGGGWVELDTLDVLTTATQVEAAAEADVQNNLVVVGAYIDTGSGLVLDLVKGDSGQTFTLLCLPGAGFYSSSAGVNTRTLEVVLTDLEHDNEVRVRGCRIDYSTSGTATNETGLTLTHGFPTAPSVISSGRVFIEDVHIGQDGWSAAPSSEQALEYRGDPLDSGYGTRAMFTIANSHLQSPDTILTISSRQDPANNDCGVDPLQCDLGDGRTTIRDTLMQGDTTGQVSNPCMLEQSETVANDSFGGYLHLDNVVAQRCSGFVTNIPNVTGSVKVTSWGLSPDDTPLFDLSGGPALSGEVDQPGSVSIDVALDFTAHGHRDTSPFGASDGPLVLGDDDDALRLVRLRVSGAALGGNAADDTGWGTDTEPGVVYQSQASSGNEPDLVHVTVMPPHGASAANTSLSGWSVADRAKLDTSGSAIAFEWPGGFAEDARFHAAEQCNAVEVTANRAITVREARTCIRISNPDAVANVTIDLPEEPVVGSMVCLLNGNSTYYLELDPNPVGPTDNLLPLSGLAPLRLPGLGDAVCLRADGEGIIAGSVNWSYVSLFGSVSTSAGLAYSTDGAVSAGSGALANGEGGALRFGQSNGTTLNTGDELCAKTPVRECRETWTLGADGATAWADSTCAAAQTTAHRFAAICTPK